MQGIVHIYEMRKRLSSLNDERTRLIFSIVHDRPMVHGMPHKVYRRCGKANCRCADGQLHGPYTALSVNKGGRQKVVMVKKNDAKIVIKQSLRYRYFQETLAKVRKINREIDKVLEEIKSVATIPYPKEAKER